jgi:hypothetical protein
MTMKIIIKKFMTQQTLVELNIEDPCAYTGTFLSRKEGGRLAQICKPAAKIPNYEREGQAETMRRKI